MTAASTFPLHKTNAWRLLFSSVKPMSRITCNSAAYRWLLPDVPGSTVDSWEEVWLGGVVFDVVAISLSSSAVLSVMFDNEFRDAVPANSNAAASWLRLIRWLSAWFGDACGESFSDADESDESSTIEGKSLFGYWFFVFVCIRTCGSLRIRRILFDVID